MSDNIPFDCNGLIYEPILSSQDFCTSILNEKSEVGVDDLPEPEINWDEWAEDTTMHHIK